MLHKKENSFRYTGWNIRERIFTCQVWINTIRLISTLACVF